MALDTADSDTERNVLMRPKQARHGVIALDPTCNMLIYLDQPVDWLNPVIWECAIWFNNEWDWRGDEIDIAGFEPMTLDSFLSYAAA